MTAVSIGVWTALQAAAAHAAAPPPAKGDELEEVVVTGFRASLESARDRKRDSNQQIESIVPEDIGKMPDQNVAESLQRLPGVQINRAGGKGTQVLIDGLANNLITLNGEVFLTGREFYVSGEASGGGTGSNVQYQSLEGIPSEEIGGIDVIKNPTAANREGGLGGIVDLRTRSALAQQDGFNIATNLRGTKATDAEGGVTPNVTVVGGYKLNDRFAITVGASYDDQKTHTKEFQDQNRNQWLITNAAQVGSYVGSPDTPTLSRLPNGQFYIEPQLAYFSDILEENKTKGATLSAEGRWTDSITTQFNYFYVREEDESVTYSNKTWFNGQGAAPGALLPGIDPSKPYSIDSNGVVQSATFMANGAETATLYQNAEATAHNFQLLTTFGGEGPLTGDVGIFYAKAKKDLQAAQADIEHGLYNWSSPAGGGVTSPAAPGCNNGSSNCADGNHGYAFTWSNGGSSGLPHVNYPNAFGFTDVLSNPAYTTFKSNWAWAEFSNEKNQSVRANANYAFTDNFALSAGLRYAKRDVSEDFGRYLIDAATLGTGGVGAGTVAGNCCIAAGQSGTNIYFSDPGYAAIPFSIAGTLPAGSVGRSNPGLVRYYSSFASGRIAVKDPNTGGMKDPSTYLSTLWTQAGVPNTTEKFFKDTLSSFDVGEKSTAAYVMGTFGNRELGFHLDGGVRVVKTDLDIDGGQTAPFPTFFGTASWNGLNSNNIEVHHSRSYTDTLPSLNFVYDINDSQKIRFGAAKVVAPQNLLQLGVGNSYNFTRGANGPNNTPRFQFANGQAGNPDLDPFRAKQFSVAWEDYLGTSGVVNVRLFYKHVDNFVTIANIPTLVPDDFGGNVGNVTTPVNAGKGKIYGGEVGGEYAFESGFGLAANYTRSNSTSAQDTAFARDIPIPGVSKDAVNLIGFYEKFGFSARVAYAWRSSAVNSSLVGSTFSFPDQNGVQKVYGVYSADYGQIDGQVGYDFPNNIGILLSVVNLTNEKQHTYLQFKNLPFTYDDSGRRIFFGVKAKW
jgi:TonB-dependent receptor